MAGQNTELTFEVRDEFNRKIIAERIIRLLESGIPVSPVVIDGDWGSGKTEFCHKLINLLEQQSKDSDKPPVRAVFVDAFKADHADNPLMTLITAVLSVLPEAERSPIKEKVMPMLRFSLKTAGKAAISWALRQEFTEMADDFESDLKKAGDSLVDVAVKSMIEEHEKASESLKALQEGLGMLAKIGPVLVFIDELDRCRPDFAVSMLEVIKHAFDVEGVKFVLVTNMKQLEAAISHRYGEVDSSKYLGKFVGFRFSLPPVYRSLKTGQEENTAKQYFIDLINKSAFLRDSSVGAFRDFINGAIDRNSLSLREVEKLVKNFEIYQSMTDGDLYKKNSKAKAWQIIIGIYLFSVFPGIADSLVRGSVDIGKIADALGVEVDINRNRPPKDEEVILHIINIQSRHPNHRVRQALSEDEKYILDQFERWQSGDFILDEFDRAKALMETLGVLGLSA